MATELLNSKICFSDWDNSENSAKLRVHSQFLTNINYLVTFSIKF